MAPPGYLLALLISQMSLLLSFPKNASLRIKICQLSCKDFCNGQCNTRDSYSYKKAPNNDEQILVNSISFILLTLWQFVMQI